MPDRRWLLAAAGVVLFLLLEYLGQSPNSFANLPLGLGIAVVAWVGHWVSPLLALAMVAVGILHAGAGDLFPPLLGGVLMLCQLSLSWEGYHRVCRGARGLNDPNSATLFLVLVPGLLAGVFALLKALAGRPPGGDLWNLTINLWIRDAVGILVLAPPLVAVLTPDLVSLGLALGESKEKAARGVNTWSLGETLEIAVLAVCTGILGLLVANNHLQNQTQLVWQFWGLSLLLVVWSSLRQGLRGGTIAATSGALFTLVGILDQDVGTTAMGTLQGNLLAQCATALLVGASAGWIRASETRYRQVVGHIPVVLYSARVVRPIPAQEKEAVEAGPKNRRRVSPGLIDSIDITLVSSASREVFKCEPEELEGPFSEWLEHIHPDDHEVIIAALAQMQLEKKPVVCEYRVAGAEEVSKALEITPVAALAKIMSSLPGLRRERWVRDTLAPKYDSDGSLDGWEGVVEDITDTRELAQQVRRTSGMLQALVANLPAGIFFVHGTLGLPALVNARARELLGQREDLAAGVTHLSDAYRLHRPDGEPYPWHELPVARALKEGVTCSADDVVVHRVDGRKVRLISWAAPVNLGDDDTRGAAVWVFEDWGKVNRTPRTETVQNEAFEAKRAGDESR